MSKIRNINICISDIPKEAYTKGSNGKIYLNLNSVDYNETDQYGKDFFLCLPQTKQERKDKVPTKFCGNGSIFRQNIQPIQNELNDLIPQ